MSETIPTPKVSEILMEEFMEPMGLSAYRLAQEIHVPVSRIQDCEYLPIPRGGDVTRGYAYICL